jgi:glucosylceramidase
MKSLRKSFFGLGIAALFAAHSLVACSSTETPDGGDGNACTANTAIDPMNCGACGTVCNATQTCVNGTCTQTCQAPQIDCGGVCADTANNSNHCGGCGRGCGVGQICSNSTCTTGSCPIAQCAGACVDTQTDITNCGMCGVVCLSGQSCQTGACVGGGGTGGTGGAGPTGGAAGSGPSGGTAGDVSTGGVAGSAPTGGAAGSGPTGGAGGSGGGTPVNLPPLVTSAQNAYWQTTAMPTESTANATVTVNDTMAQQRWDGFGAAFNEKGWSVLTSQQMKDDAMKMLFSATDGAAFAWGRIPMGASDYGLIRYTLLDIQGADPAPNSGETNRPAGGTFSLARDEMTLIPYIKAAQMVKPDLRFWASPWTPPVNMKTGFKANSGSNSSQPATKPSYYDGGNMKSDTATLQAYAQYFTQFVQGYKDKGINIEIVSPQNEPGYDQNYPSCLWSGATYTTFIAQHLGPAMAAFNPPVKVMLGSLSNADTDFTIAQTALANSTAKSFMVVIGAQWNTLDATRLNGLNSGLPFWASEHKCGNYPWNPSTGCGESSSPCPAYNSTQAPNDHAYGVESWIYIRNAIKTVRVTSYNAWNAVLDRVGLGNDTTRDWRQNALVVADGGMVRGTPAYYVFRHMSQYVMPGATVVGVTGGDAVAFKNPDGSIVAVMYNSGAANNAYVVALGGKKFQFAMPGNGWATLKYKP